MREYDRLSAEGKDIYDRSVEFFRTCRVPLVEADEIPLDLLRGWTTGDPLRLRLLVLVGAAEPDDELPLVLYLKAYRAHDEVYSDVLGTEYRTSGRTISRNFYLFQKVVRYAITLREKNIPAPYSIMHFATYPRIYELMKKAAER